MSLLGLLGLILVLVLAWSGLCVCLIIVAIRKGGEQ